MIKARLIGVVLLPLLLADCSTNQYTNFAKLSEEELFNYNLQRPFMERVYCFRQSHIRSHIPTMRCMEVREFVNENNSITIDKLNVINSGRPIFQ